MTTSTITIDDAATLGGFFFTASLDGREYKLQFLYNEREGFWYLDIFDSDEVPIRQGVKIVINFPLLKRCALLSRPEGELLVVDTRTGRTEDPTLENFGVENSFVYVDAEDLPG